MWIDDAKDSTIIFDVAIEANAEVEGVPGKKHDRDSYTSSFWLLINCYGDLKNKLKDFKIVGIYPYDGKSTPQKTLSGDLVPIVKKENYDDHAIEMLEKFHLEVLKKPIKVDTEELAKRMHLTVVEANITADKSVFGQCFFNDSIVNLFDDDSVSYTKEIKKEQF